jgi:DNA (cytosine-5)-methyltransferase 1
MAYGAQLAASKMREVSLQHVWANDISVDACRTFIRNIEGASENSVICKNVEDLDIKALDAIDGFAFGFPCNDFSLVGKSKGLDGNFGPLYRFGVKVLDSHQPKWFVAENVSGLTSANQSVAFKTILSELRSAGTFGYKLYPHLYKFDQYGVPQNRRRVIIVGIRADLDVEYRVPSPRIYDGIDVSASKALSFPPITDALANNERTKQSERVIERLSHIRPGQNAFTADLPPRLRLNVKGATISQIYKRLDPEKPSYTLTGSGGGGTHVYHWSENRALTNRERARLQTFPDTYVFEGSKESVRRQIGMAVPVTGAEAIFEALFKSFTGTRYDSVRTNISIQEELDF